MSWPTGKKKKKRQKHWRKDYTYHFTTQGLIVIKQAFFWWKYCSEIWRIYTLCILTLVFFPSEIGYLELSFSLTLNWQWEGSLFGEPGSLLGAEWEGSDTFWATWEHHAIDEYRRHQQRGDKTHVWTPYGSFSMLTRLPFLEMFFPMSHPYGQQNSHVHTVWTPPALPEADGPIPFCQPLT